MATYPRSQMVHHHNRYDFYLLILVLSNFILFYLNAMFFAIGVLITFCKCSPQHVRACVCVSDPQPTISAWKNPVL